MILVYVQPGWFMDHSGAHDMLDETADEPNCDSDNSSGKSNNDNGYTAAADDINTFSLSETNSHVISADQ